MKTIIILLIGAGVSSFTILNGPWNAPESASKKVNPVESNEKTIKLGQKVYKKMCWTCHGMEGLGDGPAATSLTPAPANFSTGDFQKQTDGAIYWKLSTGRGTMAGYESSLTDDQRWAIVNYLRTLKK